MLQVAQKQHASHDASRVSDRRSSSITGALLLLLLGATAVAAAAGGVAGGRLAIGDRYQVV